MESLIALVPLIPLLVSIIIYFFPLSNRKAIANFAVSALFLSFITSLFVFFFVLPDSGHIEFKIGEWGLLMLDPLSALMSVVISGISLIVHMYSVRYMADESGYSRYYLLLGLMTSALLFMVSAGDLLSLLIVWHLIGVFLYFLLGHNTKDPATQRYAMWTMVTYRLGDLPLVLAAILLFQTYDTWSLSVIFEAMGAAQVQPMFAGMEVPELAGYLIAFAAFARSAQFLLHAWLPYTMAGPTPVSALMHAGIVNAGGFLINRFAPLYMQTHDVLHLLFVVGLVTAVIGSILMLTQNDIKKSLGYSTMGQMGFMIMECGVGAFSLAVFHLIAHGLFKGTFFLRSGGIIGDARQSDGVPKNKMYTFVVERESKTAKPQWLIMAIMTLVVPLVILGGVHWLVAEDYFQQQGAIVLLFFGWITGAQLIFASSKMKTANPMKLFAMMIASFVVVVIGYAVISHSFDLFLYPDEASRLMLFEAAGIEIFWFYLFVGIITIGIVIGWLLVYYSEKNSKEKNTKSALWLSFYGLAFREFYAIEHINFLVNKILGAAKKVNNLLRWV